MLGGGWSWDVRGWGWGKGRDGRAVGQGLPICCLRCLPLVADGKLGRQTSPLPPACQADAGAKAGRTRAGQASSQSPAMFPTICTSYPLYVIVL